MYAAVKKKKKKQASSLTVFFEFPHFRAYYALETSGKIGNLNSTHFSHYLYHTQKCVKNNYSMPQKLEIQHWINRLTETNGDRFDNLRF